MGLNLRLDRFGCFKPGTTSEKIEGGKYKLNGIKKWIGNGNKDLVAIWARNTETKQVEAYIVENKKAEGFKSEVMKNKLAMRMVQNCQITLKDCIID